MYETRTEDGRKAYVYLLDEKMRMDRIGLISTNLAEKITMAVTEAPYRVTAETISSTSGQGISHGGVWNLVQRLGERISREEEQAVKQMKAGVSGGVEHVKKFEQRFLCVMACQNRDRMIEGTVGRIRFI